MRCLSGKTQVVGIIGDPIAHSLSPLMQNAALRDLGLDAVYVPFHVTPENLKTAVDGMRALNLVGANVTLPHKNQILPLLDHVDADATLIGAVNTLVASNGKLIGYNTDGVGFIASLREDLGFDPAGKSILLFGAGGACRAAVVALLRVGVARLTLVNRNLEHARALLAPLKNLFPQIQLDCYAFADKQHTAALQQADLVVNTTSVGLKGEPLVFCPLEKIKASASICDMVYSPIETPFVIAARKINLAATDGLGMLAAQGEEAFELWFGVKPAPGLMKKCLQQRRMKYS